MFTSFPFAFWRGESGTIGLGYRYGYDFDGVDEEISFPNYDISGAFSVSAWFRLIDSGDNVIISDWGSGTRSWFLRTSSGKVQFFTSEDGIANDLLQTSLTYNDNSWHNVLVTFGSTGGKRIYLDGSLVASVSTYYVVYNSSNNLLIGDYAFGGNNFNGRLDDVQAYDFELNATQVSDIYNSGYVTAPTAAPIHHWKLGEDDTFATNWTVKDSVGSLDGTSVNMEEVDRKLGVAYSLEFDGVDEAVSFGDILETEYNEPVSWAFWFRNIASGGDIIQKMSNADSYRGFNIMMDGAKPQFRLINSVSSNWIRKRGNSNLSVGNWYHMVCTYDGSGSNTGAKIYIDGTEETYGVDTGTLSATILNSNPLEFNRSTTYSFLTRSNINLMEVSQYTSELSASDVSLLYNETGTGNGVPIDPRNVGLSPTFYCPMVGPNDSYDGTNWTITDEIAGNNGTSVNMEESDKTSETP